MCGLDARALFPLGSAAKSAPLAAMVRRLGPVVVHGSCKVYTGGPEEAVAVVKGLAVGQCSSCKASELPDLGSVASALAAVAADMVAALGGPTLSKGLAAHRALGRRAPPALERAMRALDAAAAFLRHPGTAESTVASVDIEDVQT